MPAEITKEYREKLSRVFKRNVGREKPIQGLVQMLSGWRSLDREVKKIDNQKYALCDQRKPRVGMVVSRRDNVIYIAFFEAANPVQTKIIPENEKRGLIAKITPQ